MKEWIRSLCPEIADWQVEMIAEAAVAAEREAVAREREACAKVCDEKVDAEYATGKVDHNEMGWTQACAIAIRARSKHENS